MDKPDTTTLLHTIQEGDLDAARRALVAAPGLVRCRDRDGYTPLLEAVGTYERTPEMVELLLQAGADARVATNEGYNALHCMVDVDGPSGYGDTPLWIAQLLVAAGADVEARQIWGWTPLLCAVIEGTADVLRAMVAIGGNPNAAFPQKTMPQYAGGLTALMVAVSYSKMTRILLEAGADPTVRDARGRTALQVAEMDLADAVQHPLNYGKLIRKVKSRIVALMRKHMAKSGIELDSPFDENGMTWARMIETTVDQLGDTQTYNYEAEVRQSIALIQEALAHR